MLQVGEQAPNFTLEKGEDRKVSLTDFLGKKVVLYFYPKDNTPGCTIQAKMFAETYEKFEKNGIVVIGISKDSEHSHEKFRCKYDLPFLLLADVEMTAIKAYGLWQEKKVFGKLGFGVMRSTYVIDEGGKIIKIFEKASPKTNAEEILNFLKID